MTTNELTPQFLYDIFGRIYYDQELPKYDNNECSVTQAVQCLLKSFYERKFRRKIAEPKTVILTFGKIVHLAVQKELCECGYSVEVETPIDLINGIMWSHTDALHDTHTLEIKTISRIPTDTLSQHYLQNNMYVIANKKNLGYVSYIHKPSGIIKVFPQQRDMRQYTYICMRGTRLVQHLKTNSTPSPEPSWLCQYCEYTDICPSQSRLRYDKGGL